MGITLEAILDRNGVIRLKEPLTLDGPKRVIVEILDDIPTVGDSLTTDSSSTETPQHAFVNTCRYRILRELGCGGMSQTYQAEDTNSGALVCVKRLHSWTNQHSLMQECRALAKLSHPYIVRLLDFDTMTKYPYLVMEYVEGTRLDAFVRQAGALPEVVVVLVGLRVFKAIAYAHSQDIIHRDLKPSNIIIAAPEEDLIPKVLDFGLAIVSRRDERNRITAVGNLAGTLHYMAPEQLEGAELSSACDVYAVGQMLWEILVGKPAFAGSSYCELIDEKRSFEGGLQLDGQNSWSKSLSKLVSDCTLRDPQQRPTAAEAAEILHDHSLRAGDDTA